MKTCPKNDDVWLHAMAVENGFGCGKSGGDLGTSPSSKALSTFDCRLNLYGLANDTQDRSHVFFRRARTAPWTSMNFPIAGRHGDHL